MNQHRNRGFVIFRMIITDILIAALLVAGWAGTRLLSQQLAAREFEKKAAQATPAPTPSPTPVPTPSAESGTSSVSVVETPEPTIEVTPEPVVVPETWKEKFAEHFTDEVVSTDTSYTSPNVSVEVTRLEYTEDDKTSVYFVADIYLTSIDCFQSYFAHNASYPTRTALMPQMVQESEAVIAINGDYCGFNFGGIVLRNGISYIDKPNGSDICVLLRSGELRCMSSDDYYAAEYPEDEVYQIWTFGPVLVGEDGRALTNTEMDVPYYLDGTHPRTALGYYEPGHYCFVVVDGRQTGYSNGISMESLSSIMSSLGCVTAYNMDGGGSTMMYMNGGFVNKPSSAGERDIPDILLIKDIPVQEEQS